MSGPSYHAQTHERGGTDELSLPIAGMIAGGSTTVLTGTTGFTVVSATVTGPGYDYEIAFDPELPSVPVVLAGHGGTGVVFSFTGVGVSNVATTGFIAHSDDSDDWQFIVVVVP